MVVALFRGVAAWFIFQVVLWFSYPPVAAADVAILWIALTHARTERAWMKWFGTRTGGLIAVALIVLRVRALWWFAPTPRLLPALVASQVVPYSMGAALGWLTRPCGSGFTARWTTRGVLTDMVVGYGVAWWLGAREAALLVGAGFLLVAAGRQLFEQKLGGLSSRGLVAVESIGECVTLWVGAWLTFS